MVSPCLFSLSMQSSIWFFFWPSSSRTFIYREGAHACRHFFPPSYSFIIQPFDAQTNIPQESPPPNMQIARAILISLVAAVAPALALQCSGSLKPYCCSTTALTPRGYTGSDCVVMGQSGCAQCGLCCQHLQGKVAFYCGFPEDPKCRWKLR